MLSSPFAPASRPAHKTSTRRCKVFPSKKATHRVNCDCHNTRAVKRILCTPRSLTLIAFGVALLLYCVSRRPQKLYPRGNDDDDDHAATVQASQLCANTRRDAETRPKYVLDANTLYCVLCCVCVWLFAGRWLPRKPFALSRTIQLFYRCAHALMSFFFGVCALSQSLGLLFACQMR